MSFPEPIGQWRKFVVENPFHDSFGSQGLKLRSSNCSAEILAHDNSPSPNYFRTAWATWTDSESKIITRSEVPGLMERLLAIPPESWDVPKPIIEIAFQTDSFDVLPMSGYWWSRKSIEHLQPKLGHKWYVADLQRVRSRMESLDHTVTLKATSDNPYHYMVECKGGWSYLLRAGRILDLESREINLRS